MRRPGWRSALRWVRFSLITVRIAGASFPVRGGSPLVPARGRPGRLLQGASYTMSCGAVHLLKSMEGRTRKAPARSLESGASGTRALRCRREVGIDLLPAASKRRTPEMNLIALILDSLRQYHVSFYNAG